MSFPAIVPGSVSAVDQMSHESRRRFRGIASATLTALLGKGASLLVSAATVPLTVRYLGAEGYGLWITISSAATMFFVLDIGIASTLTNLISEAFARNDKRLAGSYFATAFWLVSGIAAVLGLAGWLLWPHIPWVSIFHVQDADLARETPWAMAAAFIVFLLALPTGLAPKLLGGYQELHVSNLFTAAGSLLSFLIVAGVVYFHGSLPVLIAGFAGSAVASNLVCLLWITLFHKPWLQPWPRLITPAFVGRIFHSGGQFFVIQIAGLIIFSSDNLVISHYLSPARVTPYAVTWRLVGYVAAVQTLVIPALWPAYSEAYVKGDLSWIRATYNRVRWISIGALTVGCTIMLLFGRSIIRLWAGSAAVPDLLLVQLMCVWIVISVFATNQSCLMGATFRVKIQAASSLISALVNLVLSIIWVKSIGPAGVILATILSYIVFIVAVQGWEVRRILRGDFLQRPGNCEPVPE